MKLTLKRSEYNKTNTIGDLFIENNFYCHTLEDVDRELDQNIPESIEKKIYGETAIPKGTYKVILSYSPRFKRTLPLLLNVPGFSGIRIHPGNTEADTLGCILVGTKTLDQQVFNSRKTFDTFFATLLTTTDKAEIIITIL